MSEHPLTVLILGGYGTFGGRLAELLAAEPRLNLVIAGRSRPKAEEFCARLKAAGTTFPLALDRDGDLAAAVAKVSPDIVVDATGPFQAYGDRPYRIVEACLAAGANYLDLADGSDFVAGIARFDGEARGQRLFILSGVSSFPVLTAAVTRALTGDFTRLDDITGGIAPSPNAGVGRNVIRAIASYAGKPVALISDRHAGIGHGLTETRRETIAPPGCLPLRSTLFSLVDVPDLKVLPELWPGLRSVWMGAGPVPAILHRALIALSWLVRLRILPSLSPFAGLFHQIINVARWGEHRGGMFIKVSGATADGPVERSWHLLAEGDDGPLIPSMACAAVIRRCLDGHPPGPGARSAASDVELADYAGLFERRRIVTGIRDEKPSDPLYRRVLGRAFDTLPAPIRAMHDLDADLTAEGSAEIERGTNPLARLAAALFGFPPAAHDVPLTVNFSLADGEETWQRVFAGRAFKSRQREGRGRSARLLSERFGPFDFGLALVIEDGRLNLVLRRWTVLGLPLPLFLAPRSVSFESVEDGRFRFHVAISHPLTGLIVGYRGWLVPKPATATRKNRNAPTASSA